MNKKNSSIYLDHAAATPMDAEVFAAMKPLLLNQFANASALYKSAQDSRTVLDDARTCVAEVLRTNESSIFFTRGGTESINMAILGVVKKYASQGKHIISSPTEHAAVLETLRALEKEGFDVTYLPVDASGNISLQDIKKSLRKDTILVTLMYANNEIGTIHPIADIGRLLLKWRKEQKTVFPFFHTDACQATNYLPLQVDALHVDLLSLNGAKVYGPKSSGILFKRRGVELAPLLYGGGHENGLRPGTEDIAGSVGLATALRIAEKQRTKEEKRIAALRGYFWKKMKKQINDVVLNGPELQENRIANNLNVSFIGAEAEAVILYLDAKGIAVASGAACSTDSDEPSHVLRACGMEESRMKSSIRFTLGRSTTKKQIDTVMKHLPEIIERVRLMQSNL